MKLITKEMREFRDAMSENFDADNPFLTWFASYHALDKATYKERQTDTGLSADIYMSSIASMRFSIGIDTEDKSVILGVSKDIFSSVMAIKWDRMALLKQVKGFDWNRKVTMDWVAFSCPDIRIESSGSPDPVQLRLWLPASTGILNGWIGLDNYPDVIKIQSTDTENGKPVPENNEPIELPLYFKGKWTAPEKKASTKK